MRLSRIRKIGLGAFCIAALFIQVSEGQGFAQESRWEQESLVALEPDNPKDKSGSGRHNIEPVTVTRIPQQPNAATASSQASPTVVQTTVVTQPRLPLAHPPPAKPEFIETLGQTEPGTSPTPEDPSMKKSKDEAVISYYAAVKQSNDALMAEYEHNKWALKNRESVFTWQLRAGKIIFSVVIILVFVGVIFSGIQFFIALKRPLKRRHAESADVTTIEASWRGIKMTSSILGVVILVVSFLFFYMYLIVVFPISVVSE